MLRREQIQPEAPPITDDAVAILLHGWGAEPPGGRQGRGFEGIGFLFLPDCDLEDVWREHEAHLRARAQAWAWEPTYWIQPRNEYGFRFLADGSGEANEGPYFFGEAHVIAGRQRA